MRLDFSTLFFAASLFVLGSSAQEMDELDGFLEKHCAECHSAEDAKGQMDLLAKEGGSSETLSYGNMLALVRNRLVVGEMPPEGAKSLPSAEEVAMAVKAIDARLAHFGGTTGGGRLFYPLLAGETYSRTVEDLVGVRPKSPPGVDAESGEIVEFEGGVDLAEATRLPDRVGESYAVAAKEIAQKAKKFSPDLLMRALRRSPTAEEEQQFAMGGLGWLLSYPHFLFRVEAEALPGEERSINEFELATRLSFFLWGRSPDAELLGKAASGKLRRDLGGEIKRMLHSPKISGGLAQGLAATWLHFPRVRPKRGEPRPDYVDLERAELVKFRREVAEYFTKVIRKDGALIELLEGSYSFSDGGLKESHGLHPVLHRFPATTEGEWNGEPYSGMKMFGARVAKQEPRRFRGDVMSTLSKLSLPRAFRFEDTHTHVELHRLVRDPEDKISAAVLAVVEAELFQTRGNPLPLQLLSGGESVRVNHANAATTYLEADGEEKHLDLRMATAHPAMRVVSEKGGEIEIKQSDAPDGAGNLIQLEMPKGERVAILWESWAIADWEIGDEVFLPVVYDGEPINGAYRPAMLGAQDVSWWANLRGSGNPRPGSVVDVRVSAIRHYMGRVSAYLSPAMSYHDSLFNMEKAGATQNRPQEFSFVGLRSQAMPAPWDKEMVVVCKGSPSQVLKIHPIRILRPTLGWSGGEEIDFGRCEKDEKPAPKGNLEIRNSQEKIAGVENEPQATILYGASKFIIEGDPPEKVTCQHVGVELLGKDAKKFRISGTSAADDGSALSLVGSDGAPGLTGGESAEKEIFSLSFLGSSIPGNYEATLRITTQAGNLGVCSTGGEGEPHEGLYYLDVPVSAQVGGASGAFDRIKRLLD